MRKFENYSAALRSLRQAPAQDLSSEFIQSGIIDKERHRRCHCLV